MRRRGGGWYAVVALLVLAFASFAFGQTVECPDTAKVGEVVGVKLSDLVAGKYVILLVGPDSVTSHRLEVTGDVPPPPPPIPDVPDDQFGNVGKAALQWAGDVQLTHRRLAPELAKNHEQIADRLSGEAEPLLLTMKAAEEELARLNGNTLDEAAQEAWKGWASNVAQRWEDSRPMGRDRAILFYRAVAAGLKAVRLPAPQASVQKKDEGPATFEELRREVLKPSQTPVQKTVRRVTIHR